MEDEILWKSILKNESLSNQNPELPPILQHSIDVKTKEHRGK